MALVEEYNPCFLSPRQCAACARPIRSLGELKWLDGCIRNHAYHVGCTPVEWCTDCYHATESQWATRASRGCIFCLNGRGHHAYQHSGTHCASEILSSLLAHIYNHVFWPRPFAAILSSVLNPDMPYGPTTNHPVSVLICENMFLAAQHARPQEMYLVDLGAGHVDASNAWGPFLVEISDRLAKEGSVSIDALDLADVADLRGITPADAHIELVERVMPSMKRRWALHARRIYPYNQYDSYDKDSLYAWLVKAVRRSGLCVGPSPLVPSGLYGIPGAATWLSELEADGRIYIHPLTDKSDAVVFICDT